MQKDLYKENAYNYIKEQIITCKLMPESIIDQNELMDQLKISRTPIRDALAALEQENLVTILPRRGVLVTGIAPKDVVSIYTTRNLVEPYIARTVTPLISDGELLAFKEIFSSRTMRNNDQLSSCWDDYSFHKRLVDILGNPYLSSMMDMILSHNMRFTVLASRIPGRLDYSDQEHIAIIDAMLQRDADAAEAAMKQHMEASRKSAYQSMQQPAFSMVANSGNFGMHGWSSRFSTEKDGSNF